MYSKIEFSIIFEALNKKLIFLRSLNYSRLLNKKESIVFNTFPKPSAAISVQMQQIL
jgi:hypothetical protein